MRTEPGRSPAERAPQVARCARAVLDRLDLPQNPYLAALGDGSLTLEAFQEGQQQLYYAVQFYSRPLSALLAKLADPALRLELLQIVMRTGGELRQADLATFERFLATIGCDVSRLGDIFLWPEVRAYNSVLLTACVYDEMEVGAACLGIIEQAGARVGAAIGRGVVERGWVEEDELVHYTQGEQDERLAEAFYRVVEPQWSDPERRYFVEQGLEMGGYVLDRLLRDLHARSLSSE